MPPKKAKAKSAKSAKVEKVKEVLAKGSGKWKVSDNKKKKSPKSKEIIDVSVFYSVANIFD